MLEYFQDLIMAILFGGMVTFQILFAPLVFTKLEMSIARPFIRQFFPFYYVYFGLMSAILLILAIIQSDIYLTMWFGAIASGFIISRQFLMPKANQATDSKNTKAFKAYHMATVVINTMQLLALLWIYYALV